MFVEQQLLRQDRGERFQVPEILSGQHRKTV